MKVEETVVGSSEAEIDKTQGTMRLLDPIDEENRKSTVEEKFSAMSNKLMDMISRSSQCEEKASSQTTRKSKEYQDLTIPMQQVDIVIVSESRPMLSRSLN